MFTLLFFKVTIGQEILPTRPPTGSVLAQQILDEGQRYRIIPTESNSLYDTERAFTIYLYGDYGNGDIPRITQVLQSGILPNQNVDVTVLSLDRYITPGNTKQPITKVSVTYTRFSFFYNTNDLPVC